MASTVEAALEGPKLLVTQSGNKRCYATEVQIYNNATGTVAFTFNPRVVVSINNQRVVEAFPSSDLKREERPKCR